LHVLFDEYKDHLPQRRRDIRDEFMMASEGGSRPAGSVQVWTYGGETAIQQVARYWGLRGVADLKETNVGVLVERSLGAIAEAQAPEGWSEFEKVRQGLIAEAARAALVFMGKGEPPAADPLEPVEGETPVQSWERGRRYAQGLAGGDAEGGD